MNDISNFAKDLFDETFVNEEPNTSIDMSYSNALQTFEEQVFNLTGTPAFMLWERELTEDEYNAFYEAQESACYNNELNTLGEQA